jgi:hypothetical protein
MLRTVPQLEAVVEFPDVAVTFDNDEILRTPLHATALSTCGGFSASGFRHRRKEGGAPGQRG